MASRYWSSTTARPSAAPPRLCWRRKVAKCSPRSLAKIADHQPDIVFVDIMMPRLDGYQTCSLIKHNKVFRTTPVIMLSSKDGLFDRARGRIVGSEHYLTKPFTRDELLGAIETHVGK
jgi:twitching motility two-component system response regulator PilG